MHKLKLNNTTYSFLDVRVYKFNETCCEDNGVPEDCMDECREKIQGRSVSIELPKSRCFEHKETIKSCMYVEAKGK